MSISPENSLLFLCDIQKKFEKAIHRWDNVLHTARKMLTFAEILSIPVLATEQNPQALGPTDPAIGLSSLPSELNLGNFSKTKFSMVLPETIAIIRSRQIKHVLIIGIEAHICVLQTALELLSLQDELGWKVEVYVLADGVGSTHPAEVPIALSRLAQAGAHITTSESILFQLQHDASQPTFKAFTKQIKAEKQGTRKALDAIDSGSKL